ncbi:CPBP family intramembrane glutamic endopeptidase [Micromonospora sp. NPDC049204]|uniref:CPBP family intramembrane glutamic endopeptidase n=1 Tax=unclassified Micromonospora TaxID=2617518 RepID=UPI00340E007C
MPRIKGLGTFLLITFGATWTVEITLYLLGFSLADPLVQILSLGWIAPAAAAFIVRRWVTREGFADAGLALRLRAAWPHYLAAWLGPLAFTVAAVGIAAALGLWRPTLAPLNELAPGLPWWASLIVLMLVVPLLAPLYWGEEFGWTSYLRLRIFPGRPLAATLATGLIWAVWHYPLPFLGYIEFSNVTLGLLVWTVSFLCQEIILAWLRLRSGSIWTTSVAHAGNNMTLSLLTGTLLGEASNVIAVTVLMTAPMAAVAGWILLSGRYRAVPQRPPHQRFAASTGHQREPSR